MRALSIALILVGFSTLTMSCQNPVQQAGAEVDRALEKVDRTIETSEQRVARLLETARADIKQTTDNLRVAYSESLKETSAEITGLREDLNRDVTALEAKLEQRITQAESAALRVVKEGDAAAEARIDQVFSELRVFIAETLAQIKEMILPVIEMAGKIGTAVEGGQEHFATAMEAILGLIEKVSAILTEVQETIREFRGKDPKTGEDTGEEGLLGLIAGLLGAALATWTQWQRKRDQGRDGDRWKPEELTARTRVDISEAIKSGEFDDELRGRLVALGMISTKPNGGEQ